VYSSATRARVPASASSAGPRQGSAGGPHLSQRVQFHRKLRPSTLGTTLKITQMSALVIQGAALQTQKESFGQKPFNHALAVFA
jgi:hypothetical protein